MREGFEPAAGLVGGELGAEEDAAAEVGEVVGGGVDATASLGGLLAGWFGVRLDWGGGRLTGLRRRRRRPSSYRLGV